MGRIVLANEKENPDLFWALRGSVLFARISHLGAGPNFGVVTEFTFQAYDQTTDGWSGILIYTPDKIPVVVAAVEELRKVARQVQRWQLELDVVLALPSQLFCYLRSSTAQKLKEEKHSSILWILVQWLR